MDEDRIGKIAYEILDRKKQMEKYEKRKILALNPFNHSVLPPEHPKITIERDEEVKLGLRFITDIYLSGQSAAISFLGDYGIGKTHLLRYIRDDIFISNNSLGDEKIALIYAKTAGSCFNDLYQNLIDDIIAIDTEISKKNLISESINKLVDSYLNLKNEQDLRKEISNLDRYLLDEKETKNSKEIFANLKMKSPITLVPIVQKIVEKQIKDKIIARAFSLIYLFQNDINGKIAIEFIKGNKISKNESERLKLSYGYKIDEINILRLIKLLLKESYSTIIFMIDEFEDWITTNTSRKVRILSLTKFRQAIDAFYENIGWIMFSIPDHWNEAMRDYNALLRRFYDPIILRTFNLKEFKHFIIEYLSHPIIGYWKENNENYKKSYPFSENVIEAIFNYVISERNGRIGQFSIICYELFSKYLLTRNEITVNDFDELINKSESILDFLY